MNEAENADQKPNESEGEGMTILDDKLLLFRDDGEPTFNYQAMFEWGWKVNTHALVSSLSGHYWRQSSGFSNQRSVSEGHDKSSFRSRYIYKNNGAWLAVGSSTCSRSPAYR